MCRLWATRIKIPGVDIDAGKDCAPAEKHVPTHRPGVLGILGGFGGLFAAKELPGAVLVAGTDGVGTKLKITFLLDKHDTTARTPWPCVNDILVRGRTAFS